MRRGSAKACACPAPLARYGPKPSSASPRPTATAFRRTAARRRVMRGEHARRLDGGSAAATQRRRRRRPRSPRRAMPPGRSRPQRAVVDLDDGRFQADRRRPAIDDQRDAATEIGRHGGRRGGADAARGIGAGGGERPPEPGDEAGAEAAWHAQRHRVKACGDQADAPARRRQAAARGSAGPARNALRAARDSGSKTAIVRAMARSATWAISGLKRGRPLASKIARHRLAIGGVAGQAIDRLRGNGDDLAPDKQGVRLLQRVVRMHQLSHHNGPISEGRTRPQGRDDALNCSQARNRASISSR